MTLSFNAVEFRKAVAKNLNQMGIIPKAGIPKELPYLASFIDHIATSTSQMEANTKLLNLLDFMGQIANQFKCADVNDVDQSQITDALIEVYVSNAASSVNLNDANVVRATQSCLCCWVRSETSMESVMFRIGNLMVAIGVLTTVLGVITETANDIERAPEPEPN